VQARDGGHEAEAYHLRSAGEVEASIEPLLRAAQERITLGHYQRAEELLAQRDESLAADDPRTGRGWVLRSSIGRFRGDQTAALAAIDAIQPFEKHPGWEVVVADMYVARGALEHLRGDSRKAVVYLREAER
jgi:hypothetical protein